MKLTVVFGCMVVLFCLSVPCFALDAKEEYAIKKRIEGLSNKIHGFYNVRDIDIILERGDLYTEIGNFYRAQEDVALVLKLEPGNEEAYTLRSRIYRLQGENQKAETTILEGIKKRNSLLVMDLTHRVQLGSKSLNLYFRRGKAYADLGKYSMAHQDVNKILFLAPGISDAYFLRARIYQMEGKIEKSKLAMRKSLGVKLPQAIDELTQDFVYTRVSGADSGIIAKHTEAIARDPFNDEHYILRGELYLKNNKHAEAMKDYSIAIVLNPAISEYYYKRIALYRAVRMLDRKDSKVLSDFDMLMRLNPDDAQVYIKRANYFQAMHLNYRSGSLGRAIRDYTSAIKIEPNNPEAYNSRGIVYQQLNQSDSAIADFSTAIELDSNYIYAFLKRANIYHSLKLYELSIDDYDRALVIRPGLKVAESKKASVESELSILREKEVNLMDAINESPSSIDLYVQRARLNFRNGRYEESIRDLDTAVKMSLNDADLYYLRSQCHDVMGDREKALADLTKVIHLRLGHAKPELYRARANLYQKLRKGSLAMADEKMYRELSKSDLPKARIKRSKRMYVISNSHSAEQLVDGDTIETLSNESFSDSE